MTPKEFFEQFPNESKVLKVGDSLFFQNYYASARETSERTGAQVEVIEKEASTPSEKPKK